MKTDVAQVGLDVHRVFSRITERDAFGKVLGRGRLDHKDRTRLRERIRQWPKGTPVVLESTFGWGWLSDELLGEGMIPRLANSRKVAAWRDARGIAKSDRTDADLLSEQKGPGYFSANANDGDAGIPANPPRNWSHRSATAGKK